jgi:hypothetical protein
MAGIAAFSKFEQFVEDLANGVHDLSGDQIEVYLSNSAPSASGDAVKTDLAEISTGNGYAGPQDTLNTGGQTAGVYTLTGTKIVIEASGGDVGPFRYIVLFNTTPSSPADPLIAWWDYGSAFTILDGETFAIKFDNSTGDGTILTIE